MSSSAPRGGLRSSSCWRWRARPGAAPPAQRFRPRVAIAAQVPAYGELELPAHEEEPRAATGMTLDQAIDRLVQRNLNLLALRFEIPMAHADILTASLRANPIFY